MLKQIFTGKNRDVALILALFIGLVLTYHLGTAWKGEARYRDQHLGAALHYGATSFDLAHTVIPGFNATETPTILELPVWQMAAGLAIKHLGGWWGWANVVSLALFLTCLYPLFQVARRFYGERTAWWALVFFLAQGLIFLYAGEAGTDGFCLAVALWFWFACTKMLDRPALWFVPATLLGTLTAVSKLPFFMVVGLAAFFVLLKERGFNLRDITTLAGVGAVAGVFFLLWTRYTDTLQQGAEFAFVDLTLKNPEMVFWYFGDWHYRLNPANWVKAGWRFAIATLGSFSLIALLAFGFLRGVIHPAGKFFLAGGVLTTLVFTHLILHHYNYLMIYSPAVAMLCAAAWVAGEEFLGRHQVSRPWLTVTAAGILLLALFQSLMGQRAFSFDKYPNRIVAALQQHTAPTDKLIMINGGWGGDELTLAGRKGLSMWNATAFEDPAKAARLKELGFNKLVILSQSPYQNAIQIVNPGQTGIPRIFAKKFLTPLVESWPTVYATEDIIIKEIP